MKKHNYPDNSIVLEWGNKYCSFDIAIMADDLVTPVALFEIKGRKTRETISRGIQQLKRATQMLDISVPCSLVFGTNKPPYFEVFEISDAIYNDVTINHEGDRGRWCVLTGMPPTPNFYIASAKNVTFCRNTIIK